MYTLAVCPNCKSDKEVIYKYDANKFKIFFCKSCINGFTYPIPKNLSKYYHSTYWIFPGIIGQLRSTIYNYFQLRRRGWIKSYLNGGDILDVGCGEGLFGKSLPDSFQVVNIDTPSAKIKNPSVLKKEFLLWQTNQKFDAIVFWESLEHTPNPQLYLKKAKSLLKPGGLIFIEYPCFSSFESKVFKKFWYHLDPPRHLVHISSEGMNFIAKKARFKVLFHKGVFTAEYASAGLIASIFNISNISSTKLVTSNKIYLMLVLIPLGFLAFIIEYIFYLFGQSPIRLIILKKE